MSAGTQEPRKENRLAVLLGSWVPAPTVRAALAVATLAVVPASATTPFAARADVEQTSTLRVLDPLEPAASLPTAYGLGVVEVPDPPADLINAPPAAADCPLEVRAIVMGGERPFVMLAIEGDSQLLRAGEGFRARGQWYAVSSIKADHVIVRVGGAAHRCSLTSAK